MPRCKPASAARRPASIPFCAFLALLCFGLLASSLSTRVLASPPAKAPTNQTTPPRIKGGQWPTFSLSETFDPKQIKNTRVIALWTVDTKGRTKDISLSPSSGSKDVDSAIVGYVRHLRFTPAMKDGKPVECRMEHTFEISIGQG